MFIIQFPCITLDFRWLVSSTIFLVKQRKTPIKERRARTWHVNTRRAWHAARIILPLYARVIHSRPFVDPARAWWRAFPRCKVYVCNNSSSNQLESSRNRRCSRVFHGKFLFPIAYLSSDDGKRNGVDWMMKGWREKCNRRAGCAMDTWVVLIYEVGGWDFEDFFLRLKLGRGWLDNEVCLTSGIFKQLSMVIKQFVENKTVKSICRNSQKNCS